MSGSSVRELLSAPSRNIEKDELLKIINDHLGIDGSEIVAATSDGKPGVLPVLERIVVLGL